MCCNGFRIVLMLLLVVSSFLLNSFMPIMPVVFWYFASINIFTFLLFVIDKYNSSKERARVPEISLYFFSIAGGIFGALFAIIITKHKIRKKIFLMWQSLILLIWLISIYYLLTHLEAIQKYLQWVNG
ncbi:MAG: DUF1294 domain-containing protein [Sulfurospirillum sp.]|nr:DUF1294 domain-containing protein [Sulfurospirillum sp.]MBL0703354.1 DUF1294 domain-containing protein [Sulfurospirillum sp.]